MDQENDTRISWEKLYSELAKLISRRSRDKDTKVGAVIVDPEDHIIVSMGYNGLPRGLDDSKKERYERPEKYHWFEHAERNAIYNASRIGIPLKGCIIVCTHIPCSACARGIIQSGITKVFHLERHVPEHRVEECKRAYYMFKEKHIVVEYIGDPYYD